MTEDRIQLAESLLQEAVYQSRARQAAGIAIGSTSNEIPQGGCGLGDAAPGLEMSERGQELFKRLWPRETAPTEHHRVFGILQEWVDRQDAFDRKRNHFLRDFRQANGFDRRTYTTEKAQAFDEGLARINVEVDQRLHETAQKLLAD